MDNVTHALAGGLLAAAAGSLVERRQRRAPSPGFARTAAIVGVLTAELPDADLLYAGPLLGPGKLGYLLHHRGHTHTVAFAVLAAVVVWAVAVALRRDDRTDGRTSVERRALLGLALAGTLSHLVLDWTNSYGVHPFWPAVRRWYYGDAVFILEPWLWIVAIPPLLLLARARTTRVGLGLLLVGIVAAAWRVGLVERGVATTLTVGAVAWSALVLATPHARRVAAALVAWLAVEGVFFGTEAAARAHVRAVAGPALRDAVLTPAVANPLCVRALVVEADTATYRATAAVVAPFPSLRGVDRCPGAAAAEGARPGGDAVRWGEAWSAPRGELAALARARCDVAAALRFMRVPVWRRTADGGLALADLRYGDAGSGGFADLRLPPRPGPCPRAVPGWEPPRRDLLGAG